MFNNRNDLCHSIDARAHERNAIFQCKQITLYDSKGPEKNETTESCTKLHSDILSKETRGSHIYLEYLGRQLGVRVVTDVDVCEAGVVGECVRRHRR